MFFFTLLSCFVCTILSYHDASSLEAELAQVPEIVELDTLVANNYLINHDLLRCMEDGQFKNMTNAMQIFAKSHYIYSKSFINYLETVLHKIDADEIKRPILENIEEENGIYEPQDLIFMEDKHGFEPQWYDRIPHKDLMKRFMDRLELNTTDLLFNSVHHNSAGYKFRNYMLKKYKDSNVCEALAIIGFSIEETVSSIYTPLWKGLISHTDLTAKDYIFFPLHILLDDGHSDLLKKSFLYYFQDPKTTHLCDNAATVITEALNQRIIMFDEIRQEIEASQGYQCPYAYSPSVNKEHCITNATNEVTSRSTQNENLQGVSVTSAVEKAKLETRGMTDSKYDFMQKMAISARILAYQGHGFTLSGQISCRDDQNPELMWVSPYGKSLELLTPNDFILVDKDLNVQKGDLFPNRATRFHSHVYHERQDVHCMIHTHPPLTSALSMIDQELLISHMDTMGLYDDVQFLPEWPGIPFGDEEGEIISGLLSKNGTDYYTGLLAHHGLIVVADSIERATYRAIFFERGAKMLLDALSAVGDSNKIKKVNHDLATKAQDWRISTGPVNAHFNNWGEVVLRKFENQDLQAMI